MVPPRVRDDILVYVIRAGVALILLTPFVVSPGTIFPYVVGKALYSRSLIEIVFVAWMLLALFDPSCRPPRSRILVLLAAALGIAVLSAGLGVSVQRSFWSNYERMQGVIDQAHWLALAVVLASVLRTGRDWRILLTLNLAAGMAMALMTIAEYHGYLRTSTPGSTRAMATLGNPIFLGTYLGVNVTIALGFLARSLIPVPRPGPASALAREEHDPDRTSPPRRQARRSIRLPMLWAGRCFWGATALAGLWAITLTGSRGVLLGFVSGLVFPAAVYVFQARIRMVRWVAIGSVGLLGIAVVLLLVVSSSPVVSPIDARNTNPLLSRLADQRSLLSARERLLAWKAGIEGFTESPVSGWGPENYIAIWGRYGYEVITTVPEVLDHSHNKLIEELATKGLPGLLVHAALWGLAFHIVLRAAGGADPRERALVLFVGAALAGYFVQSMATPDSAVGSLQLALLLALAAHLETAGNRLAPAPGQGEGRARPPASPSSFIGRRVWSQTVPRPSAALVRTPAIPHSGITRHGIGVSLAAGTILLAGAALFANQAIHSSAQAVKDAYVGAMNPADGLPGQTRIHFERAIDGFEPLANYPRRVLFQYAAGRWRHLHAQNPAEARQLLAMVNAEAEAAVESEPENWLIYTALAGCYAAVAVTDPEYRSVAERYRDRALELAPDFFLGTSSRSR